MIPQREYFDKDIANSDNTSGYYIIEKNDFVYNPRKSADAPYGPISSYKYAEAGIVSPLYLCFRAKKEINPAFFEWYFRSSAWHRYVYMSGDSGARHDRVSIKDDTFFAMPINIPAAQEQAHIASFLERIDQRIEMQRALVDNLKKYKRGVLSVAFNEYGSICSWETTTYQFSELASRRSEKYDPRSGHLMPCVELEHIEQETGRIIGSVPSTQQNSIKSVCKSGDTIFGKLRPYLKKYAFVKEDMVCSSEIWSLIPSSQIIPEYLFYLVQTDEFIRIANISSGTKMPRAEWSNVEKALFAVPDKDIQHQIVHLLRRLDTKIRDSNDMLDELQTIKKGLLQQLFI